MEKKRLILIALLVIIFLGILTAGYFMYKYSKQCFEESCFSDSLINCERSYFVKDTSELIMRYAILGSKTLENEARCMVNVQLVQVKRGTVEFAKLEGKEMNCYTPLGALVAPEADMSNCHGILKEEIQDMIIKRMHSQIVENLGKVSEETTKIL